MQTTITFEDSSLLPTPGELEEGGDDYINPGLHAKALSDRIEQGLQARGWRTKRQIVEDWGRWIEIDHAGGYFLAVGAANMDDPNGQTTREHRAFVEPDRTHVRRWFKRIHVEPAVMRLKASLHDVLRSDPNVTNFREGD